MTQILSEEEINALMQGLEEGTLELEPPGKPEKVKEDKKVTPFFFGQRTAIRVGAMPGLDMINEHLASQLSFKLSQKVGREVHVQPKATTNQIFGRFLHSLDPPIFINILRVEPSQSMCLISISGDVMFHILESFFGGAGSTERPLRNFSPFEMKVIDRVMEVTREQIELAWKKMDSSFRLVMTRWENQPQFAAVVPLDETVFLITFGVEVGDTEGTLTICYPSVVLELFKQQLKVGFQREQVEGASAWMDTMLEQLDQVSLRLSPVVSRETMKVQDMLHLKVGDVVTLSHDIAAEMPIEVEGLVKYHGMAGVVDGRRVMRVTRIHEENP
ncbi:MAG: flagellar motor switch protein FliM [Magnetococcales bacterium]|nr:flagellar motor switch protein FliM [Magnetococcales bacterium]MBF0116292.1 flagellar motor switch protein FliM [Magnetococcales bacterium]